MSCGKYRVELSYPNGARSIVEETALDSQSAADQAIQENPAANLAKAEPGNGEASGFSASLRSAEYDQMIRDNLIRDIGEQADSRLDAMLLTLSARGV